VRGADNNDLAKTKVVTQTLPNICIRMETQGIRPMKDRGLSSRTAGPLVGEDHRTRKQIESAHRLDAFLQQDLVWGEASFQVGG
jgi:5-methylcytosine-specific restriction endonuclease McrA